jgi:hypothetical protein
LRQAWHATLAKQRDGQDQANADDLFAHAWGGPTKPAVFPLPSLENSSHWQNTPHFSRHHDFPLSKARGIA